MSSTDEVLSEERITEGNVETKVALLSGTDVDEVSSIPRTSAMVTSLGTKLGWVQQYDRHNSIVGSSSRDIGKVGSRYLELYVGFHLRYSLEACQRRSLKKLSLRA